MGNIIGQIVEDSGAINLCSASQKLLEVFAFGKANEVGLLAMESRKCQKVSLSKLGGKRLAGELDGGRIEVEKR